MLHLEGNVDVYTMECNRMLKSNTNCFQNQTINRQAVFKTITIIPVKTTLLINITYSDLQTRIQQNMSTFKTTHIFKASCDLQPSILQVCLQEVNMESQHTSYQCNSKVVNITKQQRIHCLFELVLSTCTILSRTSRALPFR